MTESPIYGLSRYEVEQYFNLSDCDVKFTQVEKKERYQIDKYLYFSTDKYRIIFYEGKPYTVEIDTSDMIGKDYNYLYNIMYRLDWDMCYVPIYKNGVYYQRLWKRNEFSDEDDNKLVEVRKLYNKSAR